jgi:hypothetical protein
LTDQAVDRYLRKLDKIRAEPEATPELSLREPLLELIRSFGKDLGRNKLTVAAGSSRSRSTSTASTSWTT